MTRGKEKASLYITSKFFLRRNFPRAILASTRHTICPPTCRDATLACLRHYEYNKTRMEALPTWIITALVFLGFRLTDPSCSTLELARFRRVRLRMYDRPEAHRPPPLSSSSSSSCETSGVLAPARTESPCDRGAIIKIRFLWPYT